MNGRLEGKTALVTGSGSGIGRATALLFAREGARVIVSDVNVSEAEETVAAIQKKGARRASSAAMSRSPPRWRRSFTARWRRSGGWTAP